MFVYEKNKLNQETGKVEQTLNITFENNKPVENPDVVITADGVTGIKSDSNTYLAFNVLTDEISEMKISSISADGEIISNIDIKEETGISNSPIIFKHTIGINITEYNEDGEKRIFTIVDKSGNYGQLIPIDETGFGYSDIQIGEYIFDIDNKKIDTPMGVYNIDKYYYNILDNLYGVIIGQGR